MGRQSKYTLLMKEKDGLRGMVPARAEGRHDRVYNAYLDELKPRENMEVQLALASSKDPRFTEFLDRVQSLKYKRVNLATIAKACNIDLLEFTRWWSRESAQRAIALAQVGSVTITRDMIEDAKSKDMPCERCDDLGFVAAPAGLPASTPGYRNVADLYIRTCPACKGNRTVRKPGDQHSRDRILEMSGAIKKDKGIVINQNFGNSDHSSAVQDLNDKMSMSPTVDVEYEPVE